MKVGYQAAYEVTDIFGNFATHGLQYQFGSSAATGGLVPNQITQRITPWQQANRTRYDAFYVQDQWTRQPADAAGRAALRARAGASSRRGMNGLLADSVLRRTGLHAAVGEGRRRATTTSRRAWVWRMTCSATAGRRSR